MNNINFHVHSTGSDGKLTPEEVVKEAIKAGITYLCFTDHFKRPEETTRKDGWDKDFYAESYATEIFNLKERHKSQINIFLGAELDWLEGYEAWVKTTISNNKFDFIIGSVHYLNVKGEWLSFDTPNDWENITKKTGGTKQLIQIYYNQLRLLAKSKLFDSIGHLDYIKINNKDFKLFSEKEEWYIKEVLDTLDEIKRAGMCIEINARGWLKTIGEQYPSEWILIEAKKREIPITIGNDFHGKTDGYSKYEEIGTNLDKGIKLAKKVGYKSILIFKNRKRKEVTI